MATLTHQTFPYRDAEHFVSFAAPFVREGLGVGSDVFIAADHRLLEPLRDALGSDATSVELHDTRQWAPLPLERLRRFSDLVTQRLAAGTPSLHLMGEPVWPRAAVMRREWARYESVLNDVLAPYPVSLVCLYNETELDREIVTNSFHTHPERWGPEGAMASLDYTSPAETLAAWSPSDSPTPAHADEVSAPDDLAATRRLVAERAEAAGMAPAHVGDLALAITEILANAQLHGGGIDGLAMWVADGAFVCQVDDSGSGVADPLTGYRPPATMRRSGRGLWLARQLVDVVEIFPRDPGTRIRLHRYLDRRLVA